MDHFRIKKGNSDTVLLTESQVDKFDKNSRLGKAFTVKFGKELSNDSKYKFSSFKPIKKETPEQKKDSDKDGKLSWRK